MQKYDDIITEQEKTGIIEPGNDSDVIKPGEVYYIPHREAVCDDRATTKVSIVYDASANKNGPSLNKNVRNRALSFTENLWSFN